MLDIFGLNISYHLLTKEDKDLYNKYLELKKEKRFEESDKLRDELISRHII